MIDKVQKAFFTLLRAGLWNQSSKDLANLNLSAQEWKELYTISINHTVDGIVYEGILLLSDNYLPPKSILLEWTVRVDRIERRNQWMDKIISQQLRYFYKHKITPILLKGQGLAKCYENPRHRICGDIDWYFSDKKKYQEINNKLADSGVTINYSPGYSVGYQWNNCEIEHHSRMIDIHNPFKQGYLKKIEASEFDHCIEVSIDNIKTILPSPLLTHIQVNAHILKHLLSFGIGLRQLCDSARVCYSYHNEVDGERLMDIYKDLGIYKWIQMLHQLLHQFIGLPKKYLPFPLIDDLNADWMMHEIWQTGNFGFHDTRIDLEKEKLLNKRLNSFNRIGGNFRKYVKYAPMEAIFFPITQLYSRFVH